MTKKPPISRDGFDLLEKSVVIVPGHHDKSINVISACIEKDENGALSGVVTYTLSGSPEREARTEPVTSRVPPESPAGDDSAGPVSSSTSGVLPDASSPSGGILAVTPEGGVDSPYRRPAAFGAVCEHEQLARQCHTCDDWEDIGDLRASLKDAVDKLRPFADVAVKWPTREDAALIAPMVRLGLYRRARAIVERYDRQHSGECPQRGRSEAIAAPQCTVRDANGDADAAVGTPPPIQRGGGNGDGPIATAGSMSSAVAPLSSPPAPAEGLTDEAQAALLDAYTYRDMPALNRAIASFVASPLKARIAALEAENAKLREHVTSLTHTDWREIADQRSAEIVRLEAERDRMRGVLEIIGMRGGSGALIARAALAGDGEANRG